MSLLGKYLEQVRTDRRMSLREAAEASGLSYTYIRDIELGTNRKTQKKVDPSPLSLKKLSDAYKIDYVDLLERAGVVNESEIQDATAKITDLIVKEERSIYKTLHRIPLLGTICAGDGVIAEECIEEFIAYPFLNNKQPDFALRVKGDSMIGSEIRDGDVVFFRSAKWAERNGQIVCVITNGEEGTLKRMHWEASSPLVKLVPDNPNYNTIECYPNEIIVCGAYAGHFRPLKDGE